MIIPDKKKMATMIVAQLHGDGTHTDMSDEGDDSYVALADEVLKAISAKSASDLADALKAFFAECEMHPHEEADEDEE